MNKNTKIIIGIVVVLIAIGGIWYGVSKQPKEQGTIKIGAVLSLTGIAQRHGQNVREGIDLAVNEINKAGGIDDKKIQVIYEDDTTDAAKTVTAVQKFIGIDKVDVIIGPTWDFLANAAIPVINKEKKITIAPSVLGDTIEVTSPYFFSTFSPVAFKQKAAEKFLEEFQNKRIGVMVINNPWGLAHLETYKKAISATDNVLAKEIILPKFDNNEMSTELALLKNLKLDAILVCLNDYDSVNFIKKVKELDIKTKILGNEHFGDIINGELLDKSIANSMYFIDFSLPPEGFAKNFKEIYKKEPESYTDTAYDTVYLIAKVIKQYGVDSENIRRGLKEIKYQGVSGMIEFNEKNCPSNKQFDLIQVKNGEFVPYE